MPRTRVLPTLTLLSLITLPVSLAGGCASNDDASDGGMTAAALDDAVAAPVAIEHVERGDAPALTLPGVRLIKSDDELLALDSDELASIPADFAHADLIVVSLGEQPTAGYWADITAVQRVGDTLYVQATVNRPGQGQMAAQVLTYPYAAAVVEKTPASHARLDVREVEGEPEPD